MSLCLCGRSLCVSVAQLHSDNRMSPNAYSFVGLTAIVAGLVAVLIFAMLRFAAAARDTRRHLREGGGGDTAVLAAALQEAVAKLKAQERATAARSQIARKSTRDSVSSAGRAKFRKLVTTWPSDSASARMPSTYGRYAVGIAFRSKSLL